MFTAEEMLNVVQVGPPTVSNDGAVVATITVVWDPQSGRHSSSIWVLEVGGEWVQRLTDPRQVRQGIYPHPAPLDLRCTAQPRASLEC